MKQRPAKKSGQPGPNKSSDLWIYIALAAVIAGIYARVATYDFINYDDPVYVTNNPQVFGGFSFEALKWAFASAHDSNWIPLTWLSHMLDAQLFGLNGGMHHLTSVILHTISSLLLFAFLKKATGARWQSAFVAFIFAAHPLHVESVAWIAERKDVLCGLFWMLTMWAYLKYTEKKSPARYAVIVAMFVLSLLAKPMAVTLPAALLLLDYWPLNRFSREAIVEKIPLFAISVAAAIIAFMAQHQAGNVATFDAIPLAARLQNAVASYGVYILQLIVPINLAVVYPFTFPVPWLVWSLGLIVGITSAVIRNRSRRYLLAGWLWYAITLLPVIGIVQIGAQSHADRYTYIPMIGFSILLAWGVPAIPKLSRNAIAAVAIVACLAWAALAFAAVDPWQNSIALFEHAIASTENNYIAYNNLGGALHQQGRLDEAVKAFESAAKIRPDDAIIQDNLGETLTASGNIDAALGHLHEAVRLRPGFAKTHVDLGSALVRAGKIDEATAEYREAIRLDPDRSDAQGGLGAILMGQGRKDEALPYLQKTLPNLVEQAQLKPNDADAHFNLGAAYKLLGDPKNAIEQFQAAGRLRPDDAEAHFNLGMALVDASLFNEAQTELSIAVRLRPDDLDARFQLARVLLQLSKRKEALEILDGILKERPDYPGARDIADVIRRLLSIK